MNAVQVVFSSPMPDADYKVAISLVSTGTAQWAPDDRCRYVMPQAKTAAGFWLDIRRCAGPQLFEPVIGSPLIIEWIALPTK